MRVLVEQTEAEVREGLRRLGLHWEGVGDHAGKVGVHLLMGGADSGDWHLYPEHCAVLIGTQDMLLSRAMNRGYAAPRARWPMEFGLLNHDCLWVMDEVQLMDVGLATSAQLQAFRGDDATKSLRPCHTWWMSATLQKDWLKKSPDTKNMMEGLPPPISIPENSREGHLWTDVQKPCRRVEVKDEKELAQLVAHEHVQASRGGSGPTLVVVNRVDRAVGVYEAVSKNKTLQGTDIRLVHSRFRPNERATWREEFLNKNACAPGMDRIIVATQVVEAGVDISAGLLITELAPWASLVQRFGRCARWGGETKVIIADLAAVEAQAAVKNARSRFKKAEEEGKKPKKIDEQDVADIAEVKAVLPYALAEIRASREALSLLPDVAPLHLEAFEEKHMALLPQLYPFEPSHLLLRHELDELFDTTPDLSGADIDISRFIRSGEERDLHVFWVEVPERGDPAPEQKPSRDALCAVPFLKARDWLCGNQSGDNKAQRLKKGMRAWVWDWQDGAWRTAERRDLYPGQTVMVDAKCGGYDYDPEIRAGKGWDANHRGCVAEVFPNAVSTRMKQCWILDGTGNLVISEKEVRAYRADELADAGQDSEELSVTERWKTIATHGHETGREARSIAGGLVPNLADLFDLAGRWHDAGKAHPAFQASIRHETERPGRQDLAKAPDAAWPCSTKRLYVISSTDRRPGFRHELASVLALFGVLQRRNPNHPALLGPWTELLGKANLSSPRPPGEGLGVRENTPIEKEILALDADRFNLLAYLVCAHHGKLRLTWHAGKGDQDVNDGALRIRGVREGDILPTLMLAAADGNLHELPASRLDLTLAAAGLSPSTGASWTERVLVLLDRYGPFTLAWLEAILRAADQRASRLTIADPLLEADNEQHELERSHPTLARTVSGGTQAASSAGDSPPRGPLDGDGRRAGGRELHPGTTRPPHSATRYVETQLGILSYQQLAPHLAERVALTAVSIGERQLASHPLDEFLILELHRRVCGDLTPAIAGRWRTREVQVGDHQTPSAWRVPMLMRDYAADLAARIAHVPAGSDERLIETLTFAEGQLLYIHPFEDFNGRTTRLFLIELLYRLELPIVDPATDEGEETQRYFAALRAYDKRDSRPLAAFWRERFENEARA
jgi:CRISPR-associated endonuclease/helicase Cas3